MPDKSPRPILRDIIKKAAKSLQPRRITCEADNDLGLLEAEVLMAFVLKKDRTWLRVHDNETISAALQKRFLTFVVRRQRHEPIAYILGTKEFYGLSFRVNKHTLIPRPDSELIVELVRERLKPEPSSKDLVWDIGTGSGAIALAIAKHLSPRRVIASDISSKALAIAKQNARDLKIKNISFFKANLLDTSARRFLEKEKSKRLIITANLPYLPLSDKKKLDKDVVAFEPLTALFAKQNGLELNEKLLRQLASFDIHFEAALFEYDPPQTKKLHALAQSLFPLATIKIHKDLAGRDRVLEITRSRE